MNMNGCLLRHAKELSSFDTDEVRHAANVYMSRGKNKDAANISAVEDHLSDLALERKRISDVVVSAYMKANPSGYAKLAPPVESAPQASDPVTNVETPDVKHDAKVVAETPEEATQGKVNDFGEKLDAMHAEHRVDGIMELPKPSIPEKLSQKRFESILQDFDTGGYAFTEEDEKQYFNDVFRPVIKELRAAGVTHIDMYHVTDAGYDDFKQAGVSGSPVTNIGSVGGNARKASVYGFLDPDDIAKGFDGILGAESETPNVMHIKVPLEEIGRFKWDSNYNVTYGTYSGIRFVGDVPSSWIAGEYQYDVHKNKVIGSRNGEKLDAMRAEQPVSNYDSNLQSEYEIQPDTATDHAIDGAEWAERTGLTRFSQSSASTKNPHTLSTLKAAIDTAEGKGFSGRLEGAGLMSFITRDRIPAELNGARYSRSDETKHAYENRVDEIYSGLPTNRDGVIVLDQSDLLSMLGYGEMPVKLAEGKVAKGIYNHGLTAEHWKKIPDWLRNPAAVFDSDTVPGSLVFIAPDMVNGAPVRVIVKPNIKDGSIDVHLLTNAYDAKGKIPTKRWVDDKLTRYIDKKLSRQFLAASGLQLSGVLRVVIGSNPRVHTDVDLVKYRSKLAGRSLVFRSESRGGYGDQSDMTLYAELAGEIVGRVDYSIYNGVPAIQMIEVHKKHRRNGYGTRLIERLQKEYPGVQIDWGMTTEDGEKLYGSINHKEVQNEFSGLFAELKSLGLELELLNNRLNNDEENTDWITEKVSDRWNYLHDRIYDLESDLYNKSPVTRLVDIRYSADGSRILAFVKDGHTYFVADNIDQNADNVPGLLRHEIGLHAMRLGRKDKAFKSILSHAELMRKMGSNAMQAARDMVPSGTPAHLITEETLGYYLERNPDTTFAQRVIAWFKGVLLDMGLSPKWVALNEKDMAGMAANALRAASSEMASRHGDVLFSRQAPAFSRSGQSPQKTVAERADAIIAGRAATPRPVDAVVKGVTKGLHIDQATTYLYNKAGFFLDRFTPETVKAGVVSDYGVPGAVIDQRAMMQGRMRVQLRKTGDLIDRLSTLTRAESRVAYQWMNSDDPQSSDYFMEQLPPESVHTMAEIEKTIDRLSREAVSLGQLDPEVFKKHRFAYLRRSYVKHTAELSKGETKSRGRTISILGDQYKGRGMVEGVEMKRIQNIAPEWWQRKFQTGKADKGLKGEKFIRLERRENTGAGTSALPGMAGRGQGKLREVVYWPAGESVPTRLKDFNEAGTWEVRGTKGDKLAMWRDFTAQEREAMGEIDEARYAIAKTLHGMIHDVETGRYLEWLGQHYAKKDGAGLNVVDASEKMKDTFALDEWVQVPDTAIPGTSVKKYGLLAGRYLPGPIWNDVRQVTGGRYQPLGATYAAILGAWKSSKTALSPAVHMNNIMANFVMADWHDVTAGHITKALRLLLGASERDGKGIVGRTGNLASRAGRADKAAAQEVLNRFQDSGGNIGTWATAELKRDQLEPLMQALEAELATAGQTPGTQVGVMSALQHLLHLRFPSAWDAFKPTKSGKVLTTEAKNMLALYEAEDQVFRLAAWLKAKEEGADDLSAGKVARTSFLDYHINAPWIQMMRQTAFPFVAFTYRAVPMLLDTAAHKPWKLMKLGLVVGGLNALGYMLSGGDEDDERKLLPEEKAGNIWGMVPKLVRMPWNDAHDSPVFLDVRRWVPVGDMFDLGQNHAAIPILPAAVPGGPLALFSEIISNKSQFTGKAIVKETDTDTEQASKVFDHLYKAFAPNLAILPGTHAWSGIANAGSGKTDTFGREQSVAQAMASSIGVKVGSYPQDVLRLNEVRKAQAQMMEIQQNITALIRERQKNGLTDEEFRAKVQDQMDKKRKVMEGISGRI